jgi:transposase-like protein
MDRTSLYLRVTETTSNAGGKGLLAPRSRTRIVKIFPHRESCLRLVTALAMEQSEEWITGRRYLDMEELGEHRRIEELLVASEEAMNVES